jgi:hypothetical protein
LLVLCRWEQVRVIRFCFGQFRQVCIRGVPDIQQ